MIAAGLCHASGVRCFIESHAFSAHLYSLNGNGICIFISPRAIIEKDWVLIISDADSVERQHQLALRDACKVSNRM